MNTPAKKYRKDTSHKHLLWPKLTHKLEAWQRKLADFLGTQSKRLSNKQKKLSLLCFGIIMGSLSLVLMIEPFRKAPATTSPFISEKIRLPPIIESQLDSQTALSQEELEWLIGFTQTLDSLKLYDSTSYDHLLKDHEGLLDSINFLISNYR